MIFTIDTNLENNSLDLPFLTIITESNLDGMDMKYDLDDIFGEMINENVTECEQLLRSEIKIKV